MPGPEPDAGSWWSEVVTVSLGGWRSAAGRADDSRALRRTLPLDGVPPTLDPPSGTVKLPTSRLEECRLACAASGSLLGPASAEPALHQSCGLAVGRASGHQRGAPPIGDRRGSSESGWVAVDDGDMAGECGCRCASGRAGRDSVGEEARAWGARATGWVGGQRGRVSGGVVRR